MFNSANIVRLKAMENTITTLHGLPQQFKLAELEGVAQEVRQFVGARPRFHTGRFNAQYLLEVMQNGGRESRQGTPNITLFQHDNASNVIVQTCVT